jgi:DNA-binding NtrC family response regulator
LIRSLNAAGHVAPSFGPANAVRPSPLNAAATAHAAAPLAPAADAVLPALRGAVESGRLKTLAGSHSVANAGGVSLDQPLREARDQFERVYFEYHLARENFSMTRVADRAGLERTHLYRKLKQLGVELGRGARRTERLIADEGRDPAAAEAE